MAVGGQVLREIELWEREAGAEKCNLHLGIFKVLQLVHSCSYFLHPLAHRRFTEICWTDRRTKKGKTGSGDRHLSRNGVVGAVCILWNKVEGFGSV